MDNPQLKSDKKILKISIILSLCLLSLVFLVFVGRYIYYIPLNNTYTVEYFKTQDEVYVQYYYKGEKLSLPDEPIKLGYNFIGWSLDDENIDLVNPNMVVDKGLVLYATWQEKTINLILEDKIYKINYLSVLQTNNGVLSFVDCDNNEINITASHKEGYTFDCWKFKIDKDYVNVDDFDFNNTNVTDVIIVPCYKANYVNYNIDTNNKYNIIGTNYNGSLEVGSTFTFDIELSLDVSMSQINVESTSGKVILCKNNNLYTVTIIDFTEDFDVSVSNIETNKYSITFVDNESENYELLYGEKLRLPSISKDGYVLVGFKDSLGNMYKDGDTVVSNLSLISVWEVNTYVIQFPKSNGMFSIEYLGVVASNKSVEVEYGNSLTFRVNLASAYSESHITVYGKTQNNNVIFSNRLNEYTINNISDNIEIVVDNLTINTYEVIVDNISRGKVCYGSIISIHNDSIKITDIYNQTSVDVDKIVEDDNFYGWFVSGKALTNSSIQDLSVDGKVTINGKYSQDVCVLKFDANGGSIDVEYIVVVSGVVRMVLPRPVREGYTFVGWFTNLVEKNTKVDMDNSVLFSGIEGSSMVLYAGWTK